MAEFTKIEWATHTFNPWIGCTEVSAACDHCYARDLAHRYGWAEWGNAPRHRTSPANWLKPLTWDRKAKVAGERHRVFCASLADVFDNQISEAWRADLWHLIDVTPNIDWLLLTKRPQNIGKMTWPRWPNGLPRNIWLGTTVENDTELHRRVPELEATPATVHFLSMEPLLARTYLSGAQPNWVICGGESGSQARMMSPDWARYLRDQCKERNIAFFMKQMTKKVPIPADLMIRQFPQVKAA
jgi:protein gp37